MRRCKCLMCVWGEGGGEREEGEGRRRGGMDGTW